MNSTEPSWHMEVHPFGPTMPLDGALLVHPQPPTPMFGMPKLRRLEQPATKRLSLSLRKEEPKRPKQSSSVPLPHSAPLPLPELSIEDMSDFDFDDFDVARFMEILPTPRAPPSLMGSQGESIATEAHPAESVQSASSLQAPPQPAAPSSLLDVPLNSAAPAQPPVSETPRQPRPTGKNMSALLMGATTPESDDFDGEDDSPMGIFLNLKKQTRRTVRRLERLREKNISTRENLWRERDAAQLELEHAMAEVERLTKKRADIDIDTQILDVELSDRQIGEIVNKLG